MPAIFDVAYKIVWDNQKEDQPLSKDFWDENAVVAADNAEQAIQKAKARELKTVIKIEEDENGKKLKKPRYSKVTDVIIHHVEFVRSVDIL